MSAKNLDGEVRSPRALVKCLLVFITIVSIFTLIGCGNGNVPAFQSTASTLRVQPLAIDFGTSSSVKAKTITLTNVGPNDLTLLDAGTSTGFQLPSWVGPLTLKPRQSMQLPLRFVPFAVGTYTGFLRIATRSSYPFTTDSAQTWTATTVVPLSAESSTQSGGNGSKAKGNGGGKSAGQLAVSPSILSFGNVLVGQSKSLMATLSASGSNVTISSAVPSTGEFTLSGPSLPLTVPAGQSASFTVTFTPQASGTTSASATFTSNASDPTLLETLTGGGSALTQHSVDLSWDPSTSSVVGYNVYRGTTSAGPYTKINSVIEASTTYSDSTVQSGMTYYYVTTAVDAAGVQSGYSNQAAAVIPYP